MQNQSFREGHHGRFLGAYLNTVDVLGGFFCGADHNLDQELFTLIIERTKVVSYLDSPSDLPIRCLNWFKRGFDCFLALEALMTTRLASST